MAANTCISWENFVEIHYRQLVSIGLPEHLWKNLYSKLAPNDIHDAGSMFELHKGEVGEKWSLHTKSRVDQDQDVYLVDHAWTSDGHSNAKKTLVKNPELVKRMQTMMCLDEEEQESSKTLQQEEVIQQLSGVDLDKAKECLNKSSNDLIQAVTHAEGGDQENAPKLDLGIEDEKTVLSYEDFKDGFTASVDEESKKSLSEEFMKKMYKKYLKDSEETTNEVRYGEATTPKYSWHETDDGDGSITVLVSVPSDTSKSSVISKVSPRHWTLSVKDGQTIIDGEFYSRIQPDECFWTFDGPGVIQMTLQKTDPSQGLWPVLIKEETHLTAQQIHDEVIEKEFQKHEQIHGILESMWLYNQTYQAVLFKGGPQQHLWYVMDEVGSALTHSSTPNMRCAPFAYAVTGVFYSLMWPIADIEKGDVCTRDLCPSLTPGEVPMHKEARLLACLSEMPDEYPRSFLQDYAKSASNASPSNVQAKIAPLVSEAQKASMSELRLLHKFYVDEKNDKMKLILSSLGCHFVDKPDDATAVLVNQALPAVSESQKLNYLSGDDFLTRRDVLSRILTKKLGQVPWYPLSFNLRSQLPMFCVEHYMKGLSAMWIVRAANPNDFHFNPVVSSDLRRIIRLGETSPLVASEFHITGALSHKKHFVLQYSVLIPKLKPLELLIHNTPNIRKTPKPFNTMAPIDEYDSSMLLTTTEDITKQDDETFQDFVKNYEKNYTPRYKQTWAQLQQTIYSHILELFMAVSSNLSAPGKLASQTQGRLSAVYGVDVIIMEDMPVLITGVDAAPTFANDQVAKEVLFLMYADEDSYKQAGNHVTMVTSAD